MVNVAPLSARDTVILTNDASQPFPDGDPCDLPQIMRFTVTKSRGCTKPLTTLRNLRSKTAPITRLTGLEVDRTRSMTLVEISDPDTGPLMALMNNRTFDDTLMEPMTVKSNALEEWELINTTGDVHPMHLHFSQFQVLNRRSIDVDRYVVAAGYDGTPGSGLMPPPAVGPYLTAGSAPRPPATNEQGCKDTVVALPGEVTRIRVPFGPHAVAGSPMAIGRAHTGKYVSHCHILEHGENDMMMRFVIEK